MRPRYLEHSGLATAPGPLTCRGTTMYGFWAEADLESLRRYCKRVLAEPSGRQVVPRPYSRHVLITFVRIDEIVSEPAPFNRVGTITEREVVIWVPTVTFRPTRLLPKPRRDRHLLPRHPISAVIPCLWLDDPISVASGREVYGYPKSWGGIASEPEEALGLEAANPGDPNLPTRPPDRLGLDAYGVREYGDRDFEPRESPRPLPLLSVTRVGAGAGAEAEARAAAEVAPVEGEEEGSVAGLVRDALGRLQDRDEGGGPDLAAALARDESGGGEPEPILSLPECERTGPRLELLDRRRSRRSQRRGRGISARLLDKALRRFALSQLFLKQFRDASGDGTACHQEIVRARATPTGNFSWGRLPDYELEVLHLDSHPIDRKLGEKDADLLRLGLRSQTIDNAFVARFDFQVEAGEVLWRASR